MDLTYSEEDQAFRAEVRAWLEEHLAGEWAALRGLGGAGRDHEAHEERVAWNRLLAEHGWTCLGWPEEHGGRGLSLFQQVIFHEEYARADAPVRVNHLGEELLGPTLMAYGTPAQQGRFLPRIVAVEELWAQGYSEPDAGSDLANVQTRARLVSTGSTTEQEWVIDGQKVWTSNAHISQWAFVLCRTEPGSQRHRGLSFLLVPLDQEGVEVRPIEQLTGGSEFNEVFFTGARTSADLVVGAPGDGWRVAMALLGFERGVSVLAQVVGFARELDGVVELARENGAIDDALIRDRLAGLKVELTVLRAQAMRGLSSAHARHDKGAGPSVFKLVWANWHKRLGETAMEVLGRAGLTTASFEGYDLDRWQRLFLFSRADTIYGGSDEVQRNILAERVLGLPREPKGSNEQRDEHSEARG